MNKLLLALLYLSSLVITSLHAGSLYDEIKYESIISDHRSHKVGDILTVIIYESSSATTSTNTGTNRDTSVGASITDGVNSFNGDIGVGDDFDGGGKSIQAGKLVASVSVTITEIRENGDLVLKGDQFIEYNTDEQRIIVSGRVREKDILADNTVLSTRLADSRIQFLGEGLLSDRAKPGWITKLFGWLF